MKKPKMEDMETLARSLGMLPLYEILVDDELCARIIADTKKEISTRQAAIIEHKEELVVLRNTLSLLTRPRKEREQVARKMKKAPIKRRKEG